MMLFTPDRRPFLRMRSSLARILSWTSCVVFICCTGLTLAQAPVSKNTAQRMFRDAFELYQGGQFEAAILMFERGIKLDPSSWPAHYYLAECYLRVQRLPDARRHLDIVVTNAADSKEGALAQVALKGLGHVDLRSGLEWANEDNGSDITWGDAGKYCAEFGSGWRLPTVDEVLNLNKLSSAVEVSCGQWTCSAPSTIHLTSAWLWTADVSKWDAGRHSIYFDLAKSIARETSPQIGDTLRALCVRTIR